jgi:hypothetical protein
MLNSIPNIDVKLLDEKTGIWQTIPKPTVWKLGTGHYQIEFDVQPYTPLTTFDEARMMVVGAETRQIVGSNLSGTGTSARITLQVLV